MLFAKKRITNKRKEDLSNMKEMTLKEIQNLLGYEVKIVAEKQSKRLIDISIGETFKVGDLEFIVLDHQNGETSVLLKDFWKTDAFDANSNNYENSKIRRDLNEEFYTKLKFLIGENNIVPHKVDLTSDDGRKDYGTVEDYVSLLTCDLYRKYVYIIDKYRITNNWWWLATAFSTKSNGYSSFVRCVYYGGTLHYDYCGNRIGVRPFCIFKSNIFVS